MDGKYTCINCGSSVNSLYKKYSDSVLKLTDCDSCKNVADKYVEYDVVIVMLDLVLLQKNAYRHILFNTEFKNFWKLAVILLLVEAYSEWIRNNSNYFSKSPEVDKEHFLNEIDLNVADFEFYKICLNLIIKSLFFLVALYFFTWIYQKILKQPIISFINIWKAITISSFGIFLLLPSLIWDPRLQDFHLNIVALYTIICQLLAYTALSNGPKIWTIIAVFSSYYCKSFFFDVFELIFFIAKTHYYK